MKTPSFDRTTVEKKFALARQQLESIGSIGPVEYVEIKGTVWVKQGANAVPFAFPTGSDLPPYVKAA